MGQVKKFVTITPPRIRLSGPVGTPLMTSVSITPEKAYQFKILGVEAKHGKFIDFNLKETGSDSDPSYILTVSNKKAGPGRYYDILKLKTDSKIQPVIDIRLYGNILDAKPENSMKKTNKAG